MLIKSDIWTLVFFKRAGHHTNYLLIKQVNVYLSFNFYKKKNGTETHFMVINKISSFSFQDNHQMAKTELCYAILNRVCYLN